MDWSGDGRWTDTHTARQVELGHGTVVEKAVRGSGTRTVGAAVLVWQGRQCWCGRGGNVGRWGSRLVAQGLATGCSGGGLLEK